ncbi:hypothetical protein ACHAPU_002876 [Fusarium lateritium]
MLSLRDLGLLLLAAPMAIAAPPLSIDASTITLPSPKTQDTSKASEASAIAISSSPSSKKCSEPLRYTQFVLFSDEHCQNVLYSPFSVTWDPCAKFPETPPLSNGVTFKSMAWKGYSNAIGFYACQQGFSCTKDVYVISQNPSVCSSGAGKTFDKIVVQP